MSLKVFDQQFWFPILHSDWIQHWEEKGFVISSISNSSGNLPLKESYLNEEEIKEWQSYKINPLKQNQFLNSRWLVKSCLSQLLKRDSCELFFKKSSLGKLYLDYIHGQDSYPLGKTLISRIDFNLSHTSEVSLLGISQNRLIGVDIEKIESRLGKKDVARRFFHPSEYDWIKQASTENEEELRFYRIWSLKEAILKTVGGGVFQNIQDFWINIKRDHEEESIEIVSSKEPWSKQSEWKILESKGVKGHVCSIALNNSILDSLRK